MGRIIAVDQDCPSRAAVDEAVATLAFGGVLVMPTDSVYGIGCAAMPNNPGHERIFQIKRRERTQTLPWLIADAGDLMRYADGLTPQDVELATAFWPGAFTLVVCASDEVAPEYRGADGTIALRLPGSNLVREIARRSGCALATTSANTHGEAAATSGASVEPRIVEAADLTLDGGPAPIAIASTIVSCIGGEVRVLREGAIPRERILSALA